MRRFLLPLALFSAMVLGAAVFIAWPTLIKEKPEPADVQEPAGLSVRARLPQGQGTVMAIVDVQKVLEKSTAAVGAQKILDAHRLRFQKEVSSEEKELREAEQALQKLRETGQMEAFVEAEAALQNRFLTIERHVQSRRKALDQAYTDSMAMVREGLVDSVQTIAKQAGINLVLVKQQVIWNDQVVDITDEVLSLLNKKRPQVEVKIEPQEDLWQDPRMPVKP
ncbi:MAG: OmpH family outer membrane protein [Alphaproteobacteria bacterium]|nr:OmpH family outer membrane protein [Alphaproteobacteria bacterium]